MEIALTSQLAIKQDGQSGAHGQIVPKALVKEFVYAKEISAFKNWTRK